MEKKKSIGSNILIIVLIFLAIASVCGGLFAWAKYQSTIQGTTTGETAKWSFKVSDGDTSTQDIDFPMTRTDNNTSVAEGKIAPGTYGELEIVIDASGTETALTYIMEGTMENLPTNMKFYSDEERTLELIVLDGKFTKGGYMTLNEIGEREEKIYWEWPFETTTKPVIIDEKLTELGINKTEFDAFIAANKFTEANDMLDTAESSKIMSLKLSVTGKQLNGNPVLADLVQVGDYVNYNASSNGEKTFTSENCLAGTSISNTISKDEVYNSGAKAQWRVLSVDRNTGKVELMSTDKTVQTVTLEGKDAFINSETVLNNIGAIYGQGKGAIKGRALTLKDIEQYSTYNPNNFINNKGVRYGEDVDFTSGKFFKQIIENGYVTDYESNLTTAGTGENKITMKQTYYSYNYIDYISNSLLYNMFSKASDGKNNYIWLASRCVNIIHGVEICNFDVCRVLTNKIESYGLYQARDYVGESRAYPISIVVLLENNLKTTGQDENGVWQLDV